MNVRRVLASTVAVACVGLCAGCVKPGGLYGAAPVNACLKAKGAQTIWAGGWISINRGGPKAPRVTGQLRFFATTAVAKRNLTRLRRTFRDPDSPSWRFYNVTLLRDGAPGIYALAKSCLTENQLVRHGHVFDGAPAVLPAVIGEPAKPLSLKEIAHGWRRIRQKSAIGNLPLLTVKPGAWPSVAVVVEGAKGSYLTVNTFLACGTTLRSRYRTGYGPLALELSLEPCRTAAPRGLHREIDISAVATRIVKRPGGLGTMSAPGGRLLVKVLVPSR